MKPKTYYFLYYQYQKLTVGFKTLRLEIYKQPERRRRFMVALENVQKEVREKQEKESVGEAD